MKNAKVNLLSFLLAVLLASFTVFTIDSTAESISDGDTCFTCAPSSNTCLEFWIIKAQGNVVVGPCDAILNN